MKAALAVAESKVMAPIPNAKRSRWRDEVRSKSFGKIMDRRLRKQEIANNEDVANNVNMIIRPINFDINLMRKSSSAEMPPLARARKFQAIEMKGGFSSLSSFTRLSV
jgi:hypothetical protein